VAERDDLERFFAEEVLAFRQASSTLNDPAKARKALGQSLKWAYSLHEWLRKNQPGYEAWLEKDAAQDYLRGAQYVRDIDTHNSTTLVSVTAATFPLEFPQPFFDLAWKPLSALPAPDAKVANQKSTKDKQSAYVARLENSPARITLGWLSDLFTRAPRPGSGEGR